MDRIKNPFAPGAGSPPPELTGRDSVLEQAHILFGRVLAGRSEKSLLLTGLRGVGKTVLLNEINDIAEAKGYKTVQIEAHENKSLAVVLIPSLRKILFELDRMAGAGNKAKKALGVLRSFIGSLKLKYADMEFGLDIEPETGAADSGDIEIDLPNLFEAIGEAAKERKVAIAILIDEIQYFDITELSALIMAMHRMQQKRFPLVLTGAGLPILPGMAGESKSYAERLFSFPDLGPLSPDDAKKAIKDPVEAEGETILPDALDEIAKKTKGYPYFLQEWGYQAWNQAEKSPISKETVVESSETVQKRLDENFFRVRFDRLTDAEKRYLRAMAELGAGPHKSRDVTEKMGVKTSAQSPVRNNLIKKGMVYSPSHGEVAFTVPLFDEFMKRAIPVFT